MVNTQHRDQQKVQNHPKKFPKRRLHKWAQILSIVKAKLNTTIDLCLVLINDLNWKCSKAILWLPHPFMTFRFKVSFVFESNSFKDRLNIFYKGFVIMCFLIICICLVWNRNKHVYCWIICKNILDKIQSHWDNPLMWFIYTKYSPLATDLVNTTQYQYFKQIGNTIWQFFMFFTFKRCNTDYKIIRFWI